MAFLNIFVGGVNEGLLWALLSIGVFITFRQLDFADLTVEGSFATGGAVMAILATKGIDPFVCTLIAFCAGSLAGLVTGILHTKLKIPPILAGILTMTALYSINMLIMNHKANISLAGSNTIISYVQKWFHIDKIYSVLIVGFVFVAILCGALYWFFGTQYGSSLRATGINEKMARAQGINTDSRKICGLMISNAVIALSGAMVAQSSSYADVTMGVGAIVAGLAAVIIGETIFAKARSFWMRLISIGIGSIIYKVIIAFVISIDGFNPSDIKLITAIVVAIALALPTFKKYIKRSVNKRKKKEKFMSENETESLEVGGNNNIQEIVGCVEQDDANMRKVANNEIVFQNNVVQKDIPTKSFQNVKCQIIAKFNVFSQNVKSLFEKKDKQFVNDDLQEFNTKDESLNLELDDNIDRDIIIKEEIPKKSKGSKGDNINA